MSCCRFSLKKEVFYGTEVKASKALRTNLITPYSCSVNGGSCLTIVNANLLVCEKGITTINGGDLNVKTSIKNNVSGLMNISTGSDVEFSGSVSIASGFGDNSGNVFINSGKGETTSGSVFITTGESSGTGTAGQIIINPGAGSTGSNVLINGGESLTGADGGTVRVTSGTSIFGRSGEVEILTNDQLTSFSGNIKLKTGDSVASGNVFMTTGEGSNPGEINLVVGNSVGTNISGSVINIIAGQKSAGVGDDGVVNLNVGRINGVVFPKFNTAVVNTPIQGTVAFNTGNNKLQVYDGTNWVNLH